MPVKKKTPEELVAAPITPRQRVFAKWLQRTTAYEVDHRTAALAFALMRDFRASNVENKNAEAAERAEALRLHKIERIRKLREQAAALEAALESGDIEQEPVSLPESTEPDTEPVSPEADTAAAARVKTKKRKLEAVPDESVEEPSSAVVELLAAEEDAQDNAIAVFDPEPVFEDFAPQDDDDDEF